MPGPTIIYQGSLKETVGAMKTKIIATGLGVLLFSILIKAERGDKRPLDVVPTVDLTKYSGVWYEIARLPNPFEGKCAGDISATYSVLNKNRLKVVNRCRKKSGQFTEAVGEARLASRSGPNSRLKVRFAPSFLSFIPFVWGDYQIIELAPDYSYALVGEPGRRYLWILSRAPRMDEAVYQRLVERAVGQGFDVRQMIKTEQRASK